MGRPKKSAVAAVVPEPDEIHEEAESPEPAAPKMSKADAIRAALAAGMEGPEEGTAYILDQFGLEVSKMHFSSAKSQIKKKEGLDEPRARRETPRAEPMLTPEPRRGRAPASGPDMVEDLAAVKALVKKLGADQVRQIVELFED